MKRFFESIKDFIYDSIDYLIMILIVGAVVFVIGWRINILFSEKPLDPTLSTIDEIESDNDEEQYPVDENNNIETPYEEDEVDAEADEVDSEEDAYISTDNEENGETINIVIPPGSLPSKIGDILQSNGLVSNKAEFVSKSQEMNLDTKLKSGTFNIKIGTSLENIVKIISK